MVGKFIRVMGFSIFKYINKSETRSMTIKLKEVLKREMRAREETISAISKNAKIPSSTLHNWLQGVLPSAKNIHYLKKLADYFNITISVLLFNKEDLKKNDEVLFSTVFVDGKNKYKIIIERIEK